MKIMLHINTTLDLDTFLGRALAGLVSTTDDGDAVLAALEAAIPGNRASGVLSPDAATAALATHGTVSAAARALGVHRSTVRYAARKAVPTCPACEVRPGIVDGYCPECNAELLARADERRGGDEWTP